MGYFKEIQEFEKQARKLALIMGGKMNTKERVEMLEKQLYDAIQRINELEDCNAINLFEESMSEFISANWNGKAYKLNPCYHWEVKYEDGVILIIPSKV